MQSLCFFDILRSIKGKNTTNAIAVLKNDKLQESIIGERKCPIKLKENAQIMVVDNKYTIGEFSDLKMHE